MVALAAAYPLLFIQVCRLTLMLAKAISTLQADSAVAGMTETAAAAASKAFVSDTVLLQYILSLTIQPVKSLCCICIENFVDTITHHAQLRKPCIMTDT